MSRTMEYGSQDFVGMLGDVRLWRVVRTPQEIAQVLPETVSCTPHCVTTTETTGHGRRMGTALPSPVKRRTGGALGVY